MPKSGSTFLTDVIAELPGFQRAELTPAYGRREQELDESKLREADRFDFVAQNHVRFSDWTHQMCGDYGLAPVVLVRSLLDVVVSLRDHVRNEGHVSPVFFVEPHHAALDDARLELMIARLALPWYLGFYMSWRQAPNALVVRYEALAADPTAEIGRVLAFAGVRPRPGELDAAISQVRQAGHSRMNVGVAGRGAGLPPAVLQAVLELLEFYPEAAADPYIRATRAECVAALAGRPAARSAQPVALPPQRLAFARRWWRRNAQRLLVRGLIPLGLSAAAVAYWLWPNDLFPTSQVDDVAVLLSCGLLAGRLTSYKPRGPRLRL